MSELMIEAAGEEAEIFIEDTESDDDDEGEDEGGRGGDVPATEDDAGVLDLSVPM